MYQFQYDCCTDTNSGLQRQGTRGWGQEGQSPTPEHPVWLGVPASPNFAHMGENMELSARAQLWFTPKVSMQSPAPTQGHAPDEQCQGSPSVSGNLVSNCPQRRGPRTQAGVRAFGGRRQPGLEVCEQLVGPAVAEVQQWPAVLCQYQMAMDQQGKGNPAKAPSQPLSAHLQLPRRNQEMGGGGWGEERWATARVPLLG